MTWPSVMAGPTVQRVADAQAQLALERSGMAVISDWQTQRVTELVQWLLDHVPWWREWLGAQVDLRRWDALPILSRQSFRVMLERHGPARVPEHHGAISSYFRAGPPGAPAHFHTSAFNQRMIDHAFYADHQRQARNPYALQACISEDIPTHEGTHLEIAANLDQGVGIQLLRQIKLFTRLEHLRWLQAIAPTYLTTTPQFLEDLLDKARTSGIALPEIRQVLTYGAHVSSRLRSKARRQLGARVRHRYTCMECGPLAFQCPRSDDFFHVAVGNVMVEIANDDGQSMASSVGIENAVKGRVIVTALHQYATPMVRHAIGDTAALHSQCPGCHLEVPTLSQLHQGA